MARTRVSAQPIPVPSPAAADRRLGVRERMRAIVAEAKAAPRQWQLSALGLVIALGCVLAMGAVYDFTDRLHWFSLRGEVAEGGYFVPVLFNWWMLSFAGVAALLRSRWSETPAEQYAWIGIALFLAFMGFDELLMVHERLEARLGIDWQIVYLPVVAVGGIAYLMLLSRMARWSLAQVMWITAAGFWFISQIFEKIEYRADDVEVPHFRVLDGIEKVFQFTGSTLFLLVALLALERAINAAPADEPSPSPSAAAR